MIKLLLHDFNVLAFVIEKSFCVSTLIANEKPHVIYNAGFSFSLSKREKPTHTKKVTIKKPMIVTSTSADSNLFHSQRRQTKLLFCLY